jgi:hypothetical protein
MIDALNCKSKRLCRLAADGWSGWRNLKRNGLVGGVDFACVAFGRSWIYAEVRCRPVTFLNVGGSPAANKLFEYMVFNDSLCRK